MFTHSLADDLPTGIEDAGHNGRVHVGDVALQHVGTVHHRNADDDRRVWPNWRPATGDFSDARVIRKFGNVADDLSAL
jgi:hypothetical protein